MDPIRKLCFDWQVSDHHGWGIYGLNLLTYGQLSKAFQIIPLKAPSFLYPLDPLTARFVSESFPRTNGAIEVGAQDILLTALGNNNQVTHGKGLRQIGVIFNETNPMSQDQLEILKHFEFIVSGSTWNRLALESQGIRSHTVIQGVDLDLFRPAKKKYLKDKFVVFSGGKLEYRKGQDLLLKAFSIFSARHKDAVLLTSWRSPWERQLAQTVNASNVCEPLFPSDDMGRSIQEWVVRNGVKLDQVVLLDATPNRLMPEVFREVDLAVFPNRCEAGTNLVAMEALASGVPCLLSTNTGHIDLIKDNNCVALVDQKPIQNAGATDWGESSVAEIVDLMEEFYQGRIAIEPSAARESMLPFSWGNSITSMLSLF